MSNERDSGAETKQSGTSTSRRRQFLQAASGASVAALAGCLGLGGSGGNGDQGGAEDEAETERASNWCVEENDIEVAEEYRTAESIGDVQRNPDDMTAREDAAYQCHPQGYQLCANCRFFIPSKHTEGDAGAGACAIVEGRVRSQDWCALYQQHPDIEEFPNPDPLGESDEPGLQKPPARSN